MMLFKMDYRARHDHFISEAAQLSLQKLPSVWKGKRCMSQKWWWKLDVSPSIGIARCRHKHWEIVCVIFFHLITCSTEHEPIVYRALSNLQVWVMMHILFVFVLHWMVLMYHVWFLYYSKIFCLKQTHEYANICKCHMWMHLLCSEFYRGFLSLDEVRIITINMIQVNICSVVTFLEKIWTNLSFP